MPFKNIFDFIRILNAEISMWYEDNCYYIKVEFPTENWHWIRRYGVDYIDNTNVNMDSILMSALCMCYSDYLRQKENDYNGI